MIFQDPISSLNPRRKVGDIVAEGLDIWEIGDKASRTEKVDELLETVGLDPDVGARPPAARVLRRAVPAHLDRARGHHRAEADHLRRAGVGARRVGAGADPQPARGHEGALPAHARLHRARPRGREERERPGRGDVPRQALRGRRARRPLRAARAPVHRGAARGDPRVPTPARIPKTPTCSEARSRRPPTRRAAAGSAPAARGRRSVVPKRSRSSARSSPGQYVACHFPLEAGEQHRVPHQRRLTRPDGGLTAVTSLICSCGVVLVKLGMSLRGRGGAAPSR